jgi:hypothetical protein
MSGKACRHDDDDITLSVMRTIVDLTAEQVAALARLCQEQGISRAEAVRRAVDRLTGEQVVVKKDVGFGLWKHKRIDARRHVDRLRGEWGGR